MTSTKRLSLTLGAMLCFCVHALASIPFGRGELVFGATASASYDSNLSARSGSEGDYYGTFAPRVSYLRRAGKIEADVNLSVAANRYLDHTEYNSENVSTDALLRLSPKSFQNISASISGRYTEGYDADIDLNARIRSRTTSFAAEGSLVTGPRTRVAVQGSFTDSDRNGASDQETLSAGATFTYHGFWDDTALSLIYGYTKADTSGENLLGAGLDQDSHSISAALSRAIYRGATGRISYGYRVLNRSAAETTAGVTRDEGGFISAGIDGPFLPPRMFPKLTSRFSISYEDAETPGINDVDGGKQITGDLSLGWQARQTTTVSLSAGRTQRLSSTDLTVVSSNVRLSLEQKLRHNLSGSAGVAYNWETYRGIARKDEILAFDSSLNYTFGRSWSSSASYRYTNNSSSLAVSDFTRHLTTVSVSYTF